MVKTTPFAPPPSYVPVRRVLCSDFSLVQSSFDIRSRIFLFLRNSESFLSISDEVIRSSFSTFTFSACMGVDTADAIAHVHLELGGNVNPLYTKYTAT